MIWATFFRKIVWSRWHQRRCRWSMRAFGLMMMSMVVFVFKIRLFSVAGFTVNPEKQFKKFTWVTILRAIWPTRGKESYFCVQFNRSSFIISSKWTSYSVAKVIRTKELNKPKVPEENSSSLCRGKFRLYFYECNSWSTPRETFRQF